jgi:hypothetical protein
MGPWRTGVSCGRRMGHQQYLLALLGVLIVGIAIAVAVSMFGGHAADSSRHALIGDLQYLASRARSLYWKPKPMGGADKDFSNISYRDVTTMAENQNGRYYIEGQSHDEIIFVGVGRVVSGDDTVRVRMRVNEKKNLIEVIN